jgi:hypothetical protein
VIFKEVSKLFTAICTLLKNPRHFNLKYAILCWIAKTNFKSAYILVHLGFLNSIFL